MSALADPQVTAWLPDLPQPYDRIAAESFIATADTCEYIVRSDDRLAGTIRANETFGIWIARHFQRQGIGLRAAVLALSRRFRNGDRLITTRRRADNLASAALLEKLGFRVVGEADGMVSLTLTREDFVRLHGIRLVTDRLQIDTCRPDDLPELHRIVTIPSISALLLRFYPAMTPEESAAILLTDPLSPPVRLAVRHQGRVIGSIGFSAGDPPHVFYFLDPDQAGKGLGGEMLAPFLEEIEARFAPHALLAEVFLDNEPSRRLLERFGFRIIETKLISSKGRDQPMPAAFYRREVEGSGR